MWVTGVQTCALPIFSIFAYLCEAYIGVRPSVDLFRSIYALRSTAGSERTGCVSFRISESPSKWYIPIMWRGENAVTKVTKKVEGFRKRWIFVDAKVKSAFLDVPEAPPTKWARWASEGFGGPKLERVFERLKELRDAGVTGQMVARDFTGRRIAPLQERSEPVWRYTDQIGRAHV